MALGAGENIDGSGAGGLPVDHTVDTLLRGRVTLLQPVRGFRSSLDPVLLAAFVAPPFGRFLDIGCGTGALSFLLLAADAAATGVSVEIQPTLASLASAGRDRNGFAQRLRVITGDVRAQDAELDAASFDLVASNPPFRPVGRGHTSPDESRALANHEIALTMPDWLDVAARALRPGGRLAVIFPAERLLELGAALRARDLGPVRMRSVHPLPDRPAARVLVEAELGGRRALHVELPLIVHAADARFSPELRRILGEP
jgi:tRNA1Val (adenine37-N6)-methyltransferase